MLAPQVLILLELLKVALHAIFVRPVGNDLFERNVVIGLFLTSKKSLSFSLSSFMRLPAFMAASILISRTPVSISE